MEKSAGAAAAVPLSFKERKQYYDSHWKIFPYSWSRSYPFIISMLQLVTHKGFKSVVEMGCMDGGLAVTALKELNDKVTWTGYEFNESCLNKPRYHPRFAMKELKDYLWNLDIGNFDVFVSSHVIEHLYPKEIIKLAEWLDKHAQQAIIVAPIGIHTTPTNDDGHILEKGSLWLRDVLECNGFNLTWEAGRYCGWYSHAKRPCACKK